MAASKELERRPAGEVAGADAASDLFPGWNREQIELVKRTVAQGASDDELALFLHYAKRTGLDPLSRQVYLVERRSKKVVEGEETWITTRQPQLGIDALRLLAERTGSYRPGEVYWCGDDGEWREVWFDTVPPKAAKVVVYKDEHPVAAVARFDSYAARVGRDNRLAAMWAKMPDLMIAKCAEALALRKAFPAELSGLYVEEEVASDPEVPVVRDLEAADGGRTPVADYRASDEERAKVRHLIDELDKLSPRDRAADGRTFFTSYVERWCVEKFGHGVDYLSVGEVEVVVTTMTEYRDRLASQAGRQDADAETPEPPPDDEFVEDGEVVEPEQQTILGTES